jgi:hypothetical protein
MIAITIPDRKKKICTEAVKLYTNNKKPSVCKPDKLSRPANKNTQNAPNSINKIFLFLQPRNRTNVISE